MTCVGGISSSYQVGSEGLWAMTEQLVQLDRLTPIIFQLTILICRNYHRT